MCVCVCVCVRACACVDIDRSIGWHALSARSRITVYPSDVSSYPPPCISHSSPHHAQPVAIGDAPAFAMEELQLNALSAVTNLTFYTQRGAALLSDPNDPEHPCGPERPGWKLYGLTRDGTASRVKPEDRPNLGPDAAAAAGAVEVNPRVTPRLTRDQKASSLDARVNSKSYHLDGSDLGPDATAAAGAVDADATAVGAADAGGGAVSGGGAAAAAVNAGGSAISGGAAGTVGAGGGTISGGGGGANSSLSSAFDAAAVAAGGGASPAAAGGGGGGGGGGGAPTGHRRALCGMLAQALTHPNEEVNSIIIVGMHFELYIYIYTYIYIYIYIHIYIYIYI